MQYPGLEVITKVNRVFNTSAEGFRLEAQHSLWHPVPNTNQMNGLTGTVSKVTEFTTPATFLPFTLQEGWGYCTYDYLAKDTGTIIVGNDFRTNETLSLDIALEATLFETLLNPENVRTVPQRSVDYITLVSPVSATMEVRLGAIDTGDAGPLIFNDFVSFSTLSACGGSLTTISFEGLTNNYWYTTVDLAPGQPVFLQLVAQPGVEQNRYTLSVVTLDTPTTATASVSALPVAIIVFIVLVLLASAALVAFLVWA